MNKKPIVDILLLLVTFLLAWYFKAWLPSVFRGPAVVVSTSLMAVLIMKFRNVSFREVGFLKKPLDQVFGREVVLISVLIFGIQFIGIVLVGALFGSPEPGPAITDQPEGIVNFVLDIILVTWLVTGLGEEFIFRGFLLNRLGVLFAHRKGAWTIYLISALQAIWFGAAHPGQGISGMLIAGLVGFGLGVYFLKSKEAGLWPLICAHALIDTVVLSLSFFKVL